jgi:hypothetical protein
MPQEIGWSNEAKLLYKIKKAIKKASQTGTPITTTSTTTTS